MHVQELFPLLSLSPWPLHVILHGDTEHGDMQEISGQEPKRSTGRAALAWASCGFVSPGGPRKAVTGALCARRERGRPAALCRRLETAKSVRCLLGTEPGADAREGGSGVCLQQGLECDEIDRPRELATDRAAWLPVQTSHSPAA